MAFTQAAFFVSSSIISTLWPKCNRYFRSHIMKIGLFGTGIVGQTIGNKLIELGHQVCMGSRTANNEKAMAWAKKAGTNASNGTFTDAAAFGEMIVLATNGSATLDIVGMVNPDLFTGKTVIDLANPLDFSKGFPPSQIDALNNHTSLGEEVQKLLAGAHVVKTWNTMNCALMVNPAMLSEPGDIFVGGNDDEAKKQVVSLLNQIGWAQPIDLGDITSARATEQLVTLWVRLYGTLGHAAFNFKITR